MLTYFVYATNARFLQCFPGFIIWNKDVKFCRKPIYTKNTNVLVSELKINSIEY